MAELTPTAGAAPRKKTFGPLLYSTLLAAGLVGLYSAIELGGPVLQRWLEERRLASAVTSRDPNERRAAIGLLQGRHRASAAPHLRRALLDPDPEVRVEACEALFHLGEDPPRYADVLIGLVGKGGDDDGVDRRVKAARLLGSLRATHRGPSPGRSAAGGDADAGTALQRRTFEALSPLLHDPSDEVRAAAAAALGQGVALPEVAACLEAAASDRDPDVRLAIAGALVRLRGGDDPAAARIFLGLVDDPELADWGPLLESLRSAGEATRGRVFRSVVEAARKAEPARRPERIAVLSWAGGLARDAVPALESLLDDPDLATRAAAADALLGIQNDHASGGLVPRTRIARVAAIGGPGGMAAMMGMADSEPATIADPRALRAIRAVLAEVVGSKQIPLEGRQNALEWLQRLTTDSPGLPAEASSALVRQLGDPDPDIRRSAHALLGLSIEAGPVHMPGARPEKSAPKSPAPK
ncbi:HEAT repeat protein [Aquisphaera giovannonii]|uniref:HEAT repeat protein n=1 Tax=Aquisphaera giovannonii TaxID=406548 RepID=A0A5B9W676_9BACT|nr:HEAT repeat domain-containing protein [Aquisphaera giovannonii]QEH35659.1 HEAT repeat protein [Aquisphaera giovannonii]